MDAVAEIKSRLDIEDVVSEYVRLKRSGRNFKGLSPFTNEKTPSFVVSPEKQIWHDFSSGRGGDIFSFIQEVEGVDFKRSLEILAQKSGVDLSQYRSGSSESSTKGKDHKQRLFDAVELAVVFYQRQLLSNTEALNYLRKTRDFSKQTILDFRFGYSPEKGSPLMEYLLNKKFTQKELRAAGLLGESGGRYFDMFRGRIMVPLLDSQGRAVGFTARILKKDDNAPKYINTPATILYDKGRQLFGFSQAKNAIRKSGFSVVVEGNLDVVASHQAGVANVVASAGTALTEPQLKELQRFSADIRLAFDNDRAGQDAAERIMPIAQKLGLEMGVVELPKGKDPDDLIRENPKSWQETVDKPRYMLDWLISRIAEQTDIGSASGKRVLTSRILQILQQVEDPVEREHYLNKLSDLTKTSLKTLNKKFELLSQPAQVSRQRFKSVKNNQQQPNDETSNNEQKRLLMNLFALSEENQLAAKLIKIFPEDIFQEQDEVLYQSEVDKPKKTPTDYAKMVALLNEEMYQSSDSEELDYQARNLAKRLAEQCAKNQKQQLSIKLENANEREESSLLAQIKEADDLKKSLIAKIEQT